MLYAYMSFVETPVFCTQTAALIVDTALHLIGFPVCEDTHKTTGDGLECIPRKAASSENISTYSCQQMSKVGRRRKGGLCSVLSPVLLWKPRRVSFNQGRGGMTPGQLR